MNDRCSVLWVVRPCRGGMLTHVKQVLRRLDPGRVTIRLVSTPPVVDRVSHCRVIADAHPLVKDTNISFFVSALSVARGIAALPNMRRPRLCHAHGLAAGILLALVEATTPFSLPVVLTVHNVLGTDPGQKLLASYLLARPAFRICAISQAVASSWSRLQGEKTPDKINVIPNGWPAPRLQPGDLQAKPATEVTFLYVGRLTAQKGIGVLLRAVRTLRRRGDPCCLDVVGDGPQRQQLKRLAGRLEVADCVAFRGWTDNVEKYYQTADVLVLPSLSEGAGLVIAEAMSFGLPVLASRTGGIAEMVDHGRTGLLVPPGSSGELARTMHRLVHNATLRRDLGRQALRECHERPRWDEIAREWQRVYASVEGAALAGESRSS